MVWAGEQQAQLTVPPPPLSTLAVVATQVVVLFQELEGAGDSGQVRPVHNKYMIIIYYVSVFCMLNYS